MAIFIVKYPWIAYEQIGASPYRVSPYFSEFQRILPQNEVFISPDKDEGDDCNTKSYHGVGEEWRCDGTHCGGQEYPSPYRCGDLVDSLEIKEKRQEEVSSSAAT